MPVGFNWLGNGMDLWRKPTITTMDLKYSKNLSTIFQRNPTNRMSKGLLHYILHQGNKIKLVN